MQNIGQKELLPVKHLLFREYLLQKNDIILELQGNTVHLEGGRSARVRGHRAPPSSASFPNNKGRSRGKEGKAGRGGRGWALVAFRSSNRSREGKSRPLRRQPVRERREGVHTAQAVLLTKHTAPN